MVGSTTSRATSTQASKLLIMLYLQCPVCNSKATCQAFSDQIILTSGLQKVHKPAHLLSETIQLLHSEPIAPDRVTLGPQRHRVETGESLPHCECVCTDSSSLLDLTDCHSRFDSARHSPDELRLASTSVSDALSRICSGGMGNRSS